MCVIQETISGDLIEQVVASVTKEAAESLTVNGETADSLTIANASVTYQVGGSSIVMDAGSILMKADASVISMAGSEMTITSPLTDLN